jgi:hypothetical protein
VNSRIYTHGRPVVTAVLAALGTALVIGIPTDVVPNPWFEREIGVRPADVVVLVALSGLTGALAATYQVAGATGGGAPRAGIGSGIIGWFAVGCPVCNKIVVRLLGASGATSTFAPAQPALGAAAVALAAGALVFRVRAIRRRACPLPPSRAQDHARSSMPYRRATESTVSTQAAMKRSPSTSSGERPNVRRNE